MANAVFTLTQGAELSIAKALSIMEKPNWRKLSASFTSSLANINLKGKYLFSETGETPNIEYLMASRSRSMNHFLKSNTSLQASSDGTLQSEL